MFYMYQNAASKLPSSLKQQLLDQHMQEAEVNRNLVLHTALKMQENSLAYDISNVKSMVIMQLYK